MPRLGRLRHANGAGDGSRTLAINWGTNRWSFKPELGYSQRWNKWVFDGYTGVWFFTTNHEFYPGKVSSAQKPMGSFETHLSYDFTKDRRLWASLDGNFWVGGSTSNNGVENPQTKQESSRLGCTVSIPIDKHHQSLKISYSNGTYVQFGGNYQNVSVAWQYSWLGRPN